MPKPAPKPRHDLPRDLPSAIKHLDDQELDRLITAALARAEAAGGVGQRPIDDWQAQRRPSCFQGWGQTDADCAAVRVV